MYKKRRLGMIGGGPDSMIGCIHRCAAALDNQYDLIGGVFSSAFTKSKLLAKQLGLDINHIYSSYEDMLLTESNYPNDQRIEVISIVTPNDLHFEMAKKALLSGFHIIIDKPLVQFTYQAKELMEIAKKVNKLVCITYVYSGYPMIKEARYLIRSRKLGKIRKVVIEFSQGWLSSFLEGRQQKQALWRMNPKRSPSGTIADIGTHAFHLVEYVTGLKVTHICADIETTIPKRKLEDDGTILLKFEQGIRGLLIATQIATGDEVNINLRIYAEKGSLHWRHEEANTLLIKWLNQPMQLLRAGIDNHYLHKTTLLNCRTPAGHPEGYIEAFANIYQNFSLSLSAFEQNLSSDNDYPKIEEGARGVAFVESVIASKQSKLKWLPININTI